MLTRDDYIVQSVPWKIREVLPDDPRVQGKYGWTDFDSRTIWIAAGPWEVVIETLIHETMHIHAEGREKLDLTVEDDVRMFSTMLTDTLIRNKLLRGPA